MLLLSFKDPPCLLEPAWHSHERQYDRSNAGNGKAQAVGIVAVLVVVGVVVAVVVMIGCVCVLLLGVDSLLLTRDKSVINGEQERARFACDECPGFEYGV